MCVGNRTVGFPPPVPWKWAMDKKGTSPLFISSAASTYCGQRRRAFTSSGVTYVRPRRKAWARDAWASAIVARGEAPYNVPGGTAAVLTETAFSWGGLGFYIADSVVETVTLSLVDSQTTHLDVSFTKNINFISGIVSPW